MVIAAPCMPTRCCAAQSTMASAPDARAERCRRLSEVTSTLSKTINSCMLQVETLFSVFLKGEAQIFFNIRFYLSLRIAVQC